METVPTRPPPARHWSVLIPAFNAADSIAAAVASARGQALVPDEVLVVDDHSEDDTAAVAEAAGARVIRLPTNVGAAAARNAGLEAARSPWVAFLDADDHWLPGHLAALETALVAVPSARVVFDGLRKVTPEREFIIRPEVPAHTSLTLFSALIRRNLIPTSAAAVDRRAALEVGGMDARFRICHDYALWLRMAHRWPIVRAEGIGVIYTIREGQLTEDRGRTLRESWDVRFAIREELTAEDAAAATAPLERGWALDLRRSWTRRRLDEMDYLLDLAERIPVSAFEDGLWRRRRHALRWLRIPLALWDSLPLTLRNRVAKLRGAGASDIA